MTSKNKKNLLRLLLLTIIITAILVAVTHTPRFLKFYYPYQYRHLIEQYAKEFGVDPLLVAAIIRTESNFRTDAVSSKGALGLMQIMPETARWVAGQLKMGPLTEEQILAPEINIKLGTWYLASLLKEFDGRVDVAIAAYNGGRGRVSNWLQNKVWSGQYHDRHQIPFPETRQFLYKVRTAYEKYQCLYSY